MKSKCFFPLIFVLCPMMVLVSSGWAKDVKMPTQISAYLGKSFAGFQDAEYLSYDQVLREYLVKRIDQQFGISLDPKKYSSFDLLEIEALFKCKKSNEPFDIFLKTFPKRQ